MAKTQNAESVNTKVAPELLQAFETACDGIGLTGYDVLQRMLLAFIRTSSRSVAMTPELRTCIQEYGRYEDDSVKLITGQDARIIRAIYIMAGKSKRPTAVMTDNALTNTGDRADVNVHHILELIMKVCFPDIHRHLTDLRQRFGLPSMAATIRQLVDMAAEDLISQDIADLFGDNERAEDGGQIAYGERCKQKKRRTMESVKQPDLFEDQVLGSIFSRNPRRKEDAE